MKQVTATNLVVQPENLMALHDFFLIFKQVLRSANGLTDGWTD